MVRWNTLPDMRLTQDKNQITSGPVVGQSEFHRLVYALLAGFLVTLGLPPVPWTGVLVPVGVAWFFLQLSAAERPGRLAWVFGMAHQISLLHWLFFLIPAKSIPTQALVPIQAIAAIGYVALFYLIFGWVYGRSRNSLGPNKAMLILPVFYLVMEILRARGELAFPWCLTGSSVVGTPLISLARTSGEMGVGAAIVFSAAAGAAFLAGLPSRKPLAVMAASLWLVLVAGSFVGGEAVTGHGVDVAAVQANVSLDEKWDKSQIDKTIEPYTQLTGEAAGAGAQFVVWAETAVPAYIRYDRELMDWVRDLARENSVFLFTGFPDAQRDPDGTLEKFNSSGLFDKQGILVDRYPKHHLLPIGEAMPFTRYFPFLKNVDLGQAEWTPGPPANIMSLDLPEGKMGFSALICFESILGRLARQSVRDGSQCLLVLTNDGWFGQTAGPRQHTALAILRSAECGVPLIRCANNGISVITNHRGQVLDKLDLAEKGIVSAHILPGSGNTLFVRFGHVPLVILLFVWTLWVVLQPRKDKKNAHTT